MDERLHQGVGFYVVFNVGARGSFWGYDDSRELVLKGLRGTTQVMMYNMEYYDSGTILGFMDRAAAAGVKLMYEVDHSGWIKRNNQDLDLEQAGLAAQLDALAANISLVKHHPALLGYYM